MGKHSKATLSRINNLGHAQKNLRAQVEDITDLQDPKTSDINEMEANMKASLDNVPLLQIQRCVHMIL